MSGEGKKKNRLCIFLHSGTYDRVYQAVSISNVTLAMGGEVHIFFSYGALKRLVKGHIDDVSIEGEVAAFSEEIGKNLKRGTLDRISEMLDTAKRFGDIKLYACTASMAILNISRDELSDLVDSSMGLVSFMELVNGADTTLYI
ncbi:MAG: hypothetical protein BMS9Abin23_0446 [Thermodesulfobacteriota bacterium]|nr:MAG: hypothetical protein BMS9Abin23_0446 [Thermodesulfobacteriota bacterium]